VPLGLCPCGRALKHFCSTRLEVSRGAIIKEVDRPIGQEVRVKILKATHCHPFVTIPLKLFFGHGFSKEYSLFDLALNQGIIKQSGAWYVYGEEKFQGQANLIKYLYTPEGYTNMLSKVKI